VNHAIASVVVRLDIFVAVLPPLLQLLDTTPATRTSPGGRLALAVGLIAPYLAQAAHALAEIDVDAAVVNKHRVHLGVCLLATLLVLELDEGVLQTVARLLVADNLAAENLAEATEDQFQIFVGGDWVQLADEEHVLWRLDLGKGQIAHHLKRQGLCGCFALFPPPLGFGSSFLVGFLVQ